MARHEGGQYEFINAKLRARIGLMRESHLIDDLMKANSVVEAVRALRDGQYRDVALAYDKSGDLQQMELVLLKKEIDMYREIAGLLGGSSRGFVYTLLEKLEIENLKNALRLWFSSVVRLHSLRYRSEYLFKDRIVSDIDWTGLINAVTWQGVLKAVAKSPYATVLGRFTQQDIVENGVFDIESSLDRQWYSMVMDRAGTMDAADREVIRQVFRIEIDLDNVMILVRFGWYHKLDREHLLSLLLPWGRLYRSQAVETFLSMPEGDRNPVILLKPHYPDLAASVEKVYNESKEGAHSTELVAQATLKIEHYLQERRNREYRRILAGDPFSIGIPLAYFFLYQEEESMIKAILNGKYYGYTEDYIRGVLA
jgi:V/A-type H+-transporting ATPase subunit C